MKRGKTAITFAVGVLAGLALCGPAAQASANLTARPTTQTFYVSGQQVQFEAYQIHGNNFVKLRDVGKAVDFGVEYRVADNSVHIDPSAPYTEEVPSPAPAQTAPQTGPTEETAQAAILALKETYPHGTVYPAPYRPNDPLNRPFSNCDHCAGWAMVWNGLLLTAQTTTLPNRGEGCSLSDILIPDAPERYFLSPEMTEKLLYKSSEGRRAPGSTTPQG